MECQVILFGIKTRLLNCEHREILLNPESNYTIKDDDLCVYMCESPREIDDVNTMDYTFVRNKIELMKARRRHYASKCKRPVPTASRSSSFRNELLHSIRNSSKLQKLQQQQQEAEDVAPLQQLQQTQSNTTLYPPSSGPPSPPNTKLLRRSASNESNRSIPRQTFSLSRLPTPRLALLTGSRKLISRLGQMSLDHPEQDETSPLCFLLDTPTTLQELTITSTDFLTGHILVCMHHKVSNIFKFIYNLRSPQLKANELQDIVFLCTALPTKKTFERVSRFPKVYFMLGDCQHPEDLLKAGVMRAKQVVVMR